MNLAQIANQQHQYLRRREDTDRESRFRIQRSIPKIAAENGQKLLEELEVFEEAFAKTNPTTTKEWCMAFDEALVGSAKAWKDYVILADLGRTLYERAMGVRATQEDYANYYRYVRVELFKKTGLNYENPGEATRRNGRI